MFNRQRFRRPVRALLMPVILILASTAASIAQAQDMPLGSRAFTGGTQYDTTHVYVAPDQMDALVGSFVATFGGHATTRIITNVLAVPSRTESQAVLTPAGNLSVFAFLTPVPYPFGQERNGYLVTDLDQGVKKAEQAGAEVIVAPFQDPIGRNAVIEWPGGVKMQLYWHTHPSSAAPLLSIPESRVYVSPDRADTFVHDIVAFAQGKVVSDDRKADAGEIGRPGTTFRRLEVASGLGTMRVFVTDGHLPYPFGHELTGYGVADLSTTLAKAKASGVQVLSGPGTFGDRVTAIVKFPGGYIAEIHSRQRFIPGGDTSKRPKTL